MHVSFRVGFSLALAAALIGCGHDGLPNGTSDGGTVGTNDLTSAPPPDLFTTPPPDLTTIGPSGIGQACQGNGGFGQGTCGAGQVCIPDGQFGFTGGYCTAQCDPATPCPSGSKCVTVGGQMAFCFQRCTQDSQCRQPDYACSPRNVCFPVNNGMSVRPGTNNGAACVQPVVEPTGMGGVFGTNLEVSTGTPGSFIEAETQLAVDPLRKRVVTAYIAIGQNGTSGIGIAGSDSDGTMFRAPYTIPANMMVDMNSAQSDPVVAVDPKGNFYVSWVGFDRGNAGPNDVRNMHVWVARSQNGGISFDDIFQASPTSEWQPGAFIDKPWIAASPVDGSLYVTWDHQPDQQSPIDVRMARSTDAGKSWSTPITVSDSAARPQSDRNLCQVVVGNDGRALAAWVELADPNGMFGSAQNGIFLQRFNSDGSKNGINLRVSRSPDSPTFEDPSVASAGGNVYVGFISGTPKGDWDVRVAASTDGGMTFKPSVKVNDDPTCATHFHHQIATDTKGRLHAVWYDNRYHPRGNVFYAVSSGATANAPLSFGKNGFVNSQSFQFTTRRDQANWVGDYLGLVAGPGEIYAVWTDARAANASHIFFAKGNIP